MDKHVVVTVASEPQQPQQPQPPQPPQPHQPPPPPRPRRPHTPHHTRTTTPRTTRDARGAGFSAWRKRNRRLRAFRRHEQTGLCEWRWLPPLITATTGPPRTPARRLTSSTWRPHLTSPTQRLPLIECAAPAPSASFSSPGPVIEHVTPAPAVYYAAPAPVIKHVSFAPDSRVNRDTRGLVNPQISIFAVGASAPQVVDSSPAVDESSLPVCKQVHQEQISAEQFVESVKEVPQERLPEPIEVLNRNTPIPHSIVAPTLAREGPSRWNRHLAAQVPVIEHVTPAPVVSYSAPAPVIENISPEPWCFTSSSDRARGACA